MEDQLIQDSRNDPYAYDILALRREIRRLADANADLNWGVPAQYERLLMNVARIDEIEQEIKKLEWMRGLSRPEKPTVKRHLRLIWSQK